MKPTRSCTDEEFIAKLQTLHFCTHRQTRPVPKPPEANRSEPIGVAVMMDGEHGHAGLVYKEPPNHFPSPDAIIREMKKPGKLDIN